jgi:hypothetical protein
MPTDSIAWDAAVAALRALEGRRVSVRIAHRHHDEELVVVAQGTLGALTPDAKQPSLFWPLGRPEPGHHERAGLYLRERDFERAELRAGDIVVIEQAGVVVNVRPLEDAV